MGQTRRQHSGECKARVAFAAIRGEKTVNALAAESGVHPVQISQWKRAVQDDVPRIVSSRRGRHEKEEEVKTAFYQQIGQRKVAVDWLKKKAGLTSEHQAAADRGRPSHDQCPAPVGVPGAAPVEFV